MIVLELGDGLLGEYGVQSILADEDIARQVRMVVLCATDPVGAWGGVKLLESEYGLAAGVVTGPATDNEVGSAYVESMLGVPTANALTTPARLVELVSRRVLDGVDRA